MKNKVVVTIAGQEYTMVAVEDEAYVRKCADYVDSQLRDIMSNKLPKETAAVLAAMNMADLYFKEQDAAENLRRQIKENLEAGDLQASDPQITAGGGHDFCRVSVPCL